MKNCVDGFSGWQGLAYDSVNDWKIIGKKDLALEMRDLTDLHSAWNFARSKEEFQRRQQRSNRLRYSMAQQIKGLFHIQ